MKHVAIFMIQLYRRFLSPLLGSSCRFRPTCSVYAIQAYEKYGFFKGSYLAGGRILRCHPFHSGGDDPLK